MPVEIKSAKTVTSDFFKELNHWQSITEKTDIPTYLIYGGSEDQNRSETKVLGWQSCGDLIKKIT